MITDKNYEVDFDSIENQINEICEYISEDDYDAAKEILDELLDTCGNKFNEKDCERYFCFDSPLQYYIYEYKLKPKKMMKRSSIDFRTLYLCKAHISIAYEDFKTGEDALHTALYWNPVDCNVLIELARLYRRIEEWSKFLIVVKALRSYILSSEILSKYQAELGMYYLEHKNYQLAAALLYSAETICPSALTQDGIDRIITATGQTPTALPSDEIRDLLKKDDLYFGLDSEILSMIYDLSFDLQNKNNISGAKYCLEVLLDLTKDEKYRREIDFMENNS